MEVLARQEWAERERRHAERIDVLLAGHSARARAGQKHPVEDFLFTYYSYRPRQLRRWHPGAGVVLLDAADRLSWRGYRADDAGPDAVTLDTERLVSRRGAALDHVVALLGATLGRPPDLGCFGLHEWAMVYRADDVRHAGVPLRLGPAGTDAVVEAHRIRCSHFDAYRFFTPEALLRNELRPTRADQVGLEQPGCLHATMDLYKWAYKLDPAVPSELVADCFELARRTRELDMCAGPYDLRAHGYEPVAIETPTGRAAYARRQRNLAEAGQLLRRRLLSVLTPLTGVPRESVLSDVQQVG